MEKGRESLAESSRAEGCPTTYVHGCVLDALSKSVVEGR